MAVDNSEKGSVTADEEGDPVLEWDGKHYSFSTFGTAFAVLTGFRYGTDGPERYFADEDPLF